MKQRIAGILVLLLALAACGAPSDAQKEKKKQESDLYDLEEIQQSGEIIVLTLYGPTSYFDYRGAMMGYQYQLSEQFGAKIGTKVRVEVASNVEDMVEKLRKGEGDLIAYNLPITNALKQELIYCGEPIITHQVLVQRKSDTPIKDVTELVGKDIYVSRSKYIERLKNLNNELGGGIRIHEVPADSLTAEDLIQQVSQGKLPLTVSDNDLSSLNEQAYKNLDLSLKISFDQRASWAVRKDSPELAKAVDQWFKESSKTRAYLASAQRYFEKDKPVVQHVHRRAPIQNVRRGIISDYDYLFKIHSKRLGWDWRLLAAQAYQESGFDPTATSWAGARGLMQLMPATATAMDIDPNLLDDPEQSVTGAVRYLHHLNGIFGNIRNQQERINFILAAYNCGPRHILDAQALAEKYGKDPHIWTGHVDRYVLLLREEEYYRDPVVKGGYFRSNETYNYVHQIRERYNEYRRLVR